ncbi:hypothetical protein BN874_920005 [Candidatus Contendobacter odensis Run_B_J11]|uniref:Uncharacterized protein n=1 Tax=Candidatus Contendobacter odensis Run_B_J11 TaxID=1400861 RepID=A0A7U7GGY6_9GAMM|nr:hypothetical protein BN874_920005 [Candidatus Contendobacter odensis Run_B_J11]
MCRIQQGRNIQADELDPRLKFSIRVVKFFYAAAKSNAAYPWTFIRFKENDSGVFLATQFYLCGVRIHVGVLPWLENIDKIIFCNQFPAQTFLVKSCTD